MRILGSQILKLFQPLLLASLICGCSSTNTRPIDPGQSVESSRGVLLAEVTSDGHPNVVNASFIFRKKGSSESQDQIALEAYPTMYDIVPFGTVKRQDVLGVTGRRGRLLAVPLEPGSYELYYWTLWVNRGRSDYSYEAVNPQRLPAVHSFSIRPGAVTYLGALHLESVVDPYASGELAVGAVPNISNQWPRDQAILNRLYPNLTGWPVEIAVPNTASWSLCWQRWGEARCPSGGSSPTKN